MRNTENPNRHKDESIVEEWTIGEDQTDDHRVCVDVEDLKELLGLNSTPATTEEKKPQTDQQKKIFVKTASSEEQPEEKPCGCGGNKTTASQSTENKEIFGYSKVKLLNASASAPEIQSPALETNKPKTISRKLNETLASSLFSE